MNVDNLAEEYYDYSPYNYVFNDPIKHIDPDGNGPEDIVIYGTNNSSLTIETDLIDVSVNAGRLIGDIGGNYSVSGSEILGAALDIVGIFDPTGIADGLNASLQASEGNWGDAAISSFGIIPYAGDLAKAGKIEKDIKILDKAVDAAKGADKVNDAKKASSTKDVVTYAGQKVDPKTGQKIGPSGKPTVHTVKHASKKEAKDAARQGGRGTPVKHTKDAKGGNHYHHGAGVKGKGKGTKNYGSRAGKISDNVHHEYPE